jgi:nucleotide-binding universal stress UspA family protein
VKAIVAGYDGTEQGERALARAAELAQALAAQLVVVSVGRPTRRVAPELAFEPVDPALVPTGIGPLPVREAPVPAAPPVEAPAEEALLLERARGFLVPRRVEAEYLPEVGDPVDCLLQVAEEKDAELIVVGSREHGLLDRMLGQPVDEKLARRAHRDVLLVH